MDLKDISVSTISHYEENAQRFKEGTWDHDVSQNRQTLLWALNEFRPKKSFDILDFGCGPGRDIIEFKKLGHHVTGLDGSKSFCDMAKEASGCEVWCQNFLELNLPDSRFDGIFANASLFHIPSTELVRVLRQFKNTLRPKGLLFSSIPRGNSEGLQEKRWGHYMEIEDFKTYLDAAGFELLSYYYRPSGLARSQQPWLASLALNS